MVQPPVSVSTGMANAAGGRGLGIISRLLPFSGILMKDSYCVADQMILRSDQQGYIVVFKEAPCGSKLCDKKSFFIQILYSKRFILLVENRNDELHNGPVLSDSLDKRKLWVVFLSSASL